MRAAMFFNFLIESTLMGSVMIILTLLMRRFLRAERSSCVLCVLWLMAAVRLIVPFSYPSPVMNEIRPELSANVGVRPIADQVRVRTEDSLRDLSWKLDRWGETRGDALGGAAQKAAGAIRTFNAETSYGHTARWIALGYGVIALALGLCMLWRNIRGGRRLHRWDVLRIVCCAIHWINPLVWMAARLSRTDQEAARDENSRRVSGASVVAVWAAAVVLLVSFGTSEVLEKITVPQVPEFSGEPVEMRTISTDEEAVEYAQEVLASDPFLSSPWLSRYDTFDDLECSAIHAQKTGMWQVNVKDRASGQWGYELIFDSHGTLWYLDEKNRRTDEAHKPSNPTFLTHAEAKEAIYAYVRNCGRILMPQDNLENLRLVFDRREGDERIVLVQWEGETQNGSFRLTVGKTPRLWMFDRWTDDSYLLFDSLYEEEQRLTKERIRAAAQQANEEGLALHTIDELLPGTAEYEAASDAHGYLTEVYSYDPDTANRFVFALQEMQGSVWCVYFDPLLPNARYTFDTARMHDSHFTPYRMENQRIPEGGLRYFLNRVYEESWMPEWHEEDRQAFLRELQEPLHDIVLSAEQLSAIENGELTATQTLHACFEAVYPDVTQWNEAVTNWYEYELERFGL